MERIQQPLQGNLFDRETPLPVTTRKEILPLIAALNHGSDDFDMPASRAPGRRR